MDSQKIIKNAYASKLKKKIHSDETYICQNVITNSPCEGLISSDAQKKKNISISLLVLKDLFVTDQEFQTLTSPLVSTLCRGAIKLPQTGCYSRNYLQV